jgi:hypothetical protein
VITTVATPSGRHWMTHGSTSACGRFFGPFTYPPVLMPGACVDCPRCASQFEAFSLATLTTEVHA